jgi:multiple sugar transport system substrate-binding protein
MKLRRPLAIAAGLALVGLAMQGCASAPAPAVTPSESAGVVDGHGKKLTVLVGANTLYPQEQKKWFSDISAQFAEETGATVSFETFASASDELTRIQTSVLSGQGPDLYALGSTFTPTAYSTGAFVELTSADWAKVGGRDRFVPATLGISGPDSTHQVGIPLASRPFVMAYNKSLLAAAGIEKPATTWDGLSAQAKKLTSGDVHGMAVAYADTYDPWKYVWAMSIQAGNPIVDGTKARIDDPRTSKAYDTIFGWLTRDHVVDPAATGWKNSQAIAAFAEGKAAFLPMVSSSSKATLDASPVAGSYAYALMPTVAPGHTTNPASGKPASSILSGDNLVVAKYSPNRDLSFELVKLLTSESTQAKAFARFGDLPTNAKAAAKLKKSSPALAPIVESASKSVGTPFTGAWGDTQLALANVAVQSIPSLAAGSVSRQTLSAELAAAQKSAQTALDKAK